MNALAAALLAVTTGTAGTHLEPLPIDVTSAPLAELRALDGRVVRTPAAQLVPVLCQPDGGFDVYPMVTWDDTERGVWIPKGADVANWTEAVGRVAVIDHAPAVVNGVKFPGFVEVRVVVGR